MIELTTVLVAFTSKSVRHKKSNVSTLESQVTVHKPDLFPIISGPCRVDSYHGPWPCNDAHGFQVFDSLSRQTLYHF
jgi:hypothetical protein